MTINPWLLTNKNQESSCEVFFGLMYCIFVVLCIYSFIFLQNLLTDTDSLLYVDTDILFMRPLDDIWGFFKKMNSSQMAALAPEHEDEATGWYNRFARHPYYGKLGRNRVLILPFKYH